MNIWYKWILLIIFAIGGGGCISFGYAMFTDGMYWKKLWSIILGLVIWLIGAAMAMLWPHISDRIQK